jgi:tetratricopeptide (TPR) repeat protein
MRPIPSVKYDRLNKFLSTTVNLKPALLIFVIASMLLSACGSQEDRAETHIEKARELLIKEDYAAARIEALNAAQIDPKSVEARYILATIEERNQNFRATVGHLQVVVDTDPSHLEARLKLGNYFILAKATDRAEEQAKATLELAPDNAEVHLLNARVLYQKDERAQAENEVDIALEIDPLLIEAIMWKAAVRMTDADYEGALSLTDDGIRKVDGDDVLTLRKFRVILLRAADRLLDLEADLIALAKDFPDDKNYALNLAKLYASQDRIDETEKILRPIMAGDPTDIDLRIAFVRLIAEKRGPDQAAEELKNFIAEAPTEARLRLTLGRLFEFTKAYDDALVIYLDIASASPTGEDGLAARNRIAIVKIAQEKLEEARSLVDKILLDDPANSDALLTRAAFRYSDQAFDDAIADLRTVLRTNERSERALYLLARAHLSAGSPELAQDAYRRLIQMYPNHPTAPHELAQLLTERDDLRAAANVLRQRLEVDRADRKAASSLIQTLLAQGELDAAETAARDLLALESSTGLAEFQLGRVMQAKRSGQEATEAYKLALEKNPVARPPLEGLIRVYVASDRADEAINYLREHLVKYPTQVYPRYLLASVYATQGDTEIAEENYEAVLTAEPDNVQAYAGLASLHPNDAEARMNIYRRGFDAAPEQSTIGLLLGTEYERAEKFENAIALYEEILEINPGNDLAANNLAALLLDRRSDSESYAKALELSMRFADSPQPALVDTLGWAFYRNGDITNAVKYLEIAVAGADQSPLLHYHLGMAYFATQDMALAREELEKATVLKQAVYPGIDEAHKTLDAIMQSLRSR